MSQVCGDSTVRMDKRSENYVLVTGANGFVGSSLVRNLRARGQHVLGTMRLDSGLLEGCVHAPSLELDGNWLSLLKGCSSVVHTAARVHIMQEHGAYPLTEYRRVNVEGTLRLAKQAAETGIRRFVLISTIKVNGAATAHGRSFLAEDVPSPLDPYGISKLEAEQGLMALAAKTGMEVVIIRPPLVYGPGVKANFLSMMRWLERGVPLPFGAIDNRRSLVALDNLVDLIVTCIDHPAAANQVFLVSDGEDLSTTELLRRLGTALGKPARLLPIPGAWLEFGASLLGRPDLARRLCGSLQVDIAKTCSLLHWSPPVAVDEALQQTARHYLERSNL